MLDFKQLYAVAHAEEGDLASAPFAVLLHAMAAFERTVTIDLEHRVLQKTVVIETGVPVDCRSNLVHETLGRFMVSTGRLTEDQMNQMLRESVVRGTQFGQTLLERELIGAEDLFRVLQQNLAKKLLDLFTWREGRFRIRPDTPVVSSPLKVRVPQLVVMGVTRFATPAEVDAQIAPLVGKVLAFAADPPYALEEIRVSDSQQRVLACLREGCRLDEIATTTGLALSEITRIVYALDLLGLLEPLADGAPRPTAAAPPPAAPGPATASTQAPVDAALPRASPVDATEHARINDEIMRAYLTFRGQDALDLLGLPEDATAAQAAERYLEFAKRFWPDRFLPDYAPLAEKARDIFLAGARAYGEIADPERRAALHSRRRTKREDVERRPPPDFTIKTDLLDPELQFGKGMALLESGQVRDAITQLEFASDCDPGNGVYRAELAMARHRLSPSTAARSTVAELEEAMRIDPRCGLAAFYAGQVLAANGRLDSAEPMLRKAIKLMAPDRRPIDALKALSAARK